MKEFIYVTVKNYKQPGYRLNSLQLLPIDGWIYFFTSWIWAYLWFALTNRLWQKYLHFWDLALRDLVASALAPWNISIMRSPVWSTVGRAATARRTNCKMLWGHLRSCNLRWAEQTHPVAPGSMVLRTSMSWLSSCGVACYAAIDDSCGLQCPIWDQLKTLRVIPTRGHCSLS